jgi:hypothetical protein
MSFFTAIIGWIVSIYGFLLGVFFITFSFKTLYIFSLKWIPVAVIAATLLQYIQFGLLTRLGVPAFFRSHRVLNNAFRSGFKVDKSELGTLFNHLTMLPAHNAVSCIFYTILVGVMLIGAGFFEYRINGSLTIMEFKTINRIVVLGVVIGMILYGVSAYLLSSTIIAREKAVVYNKMIFRNQKVNPRSLITLKGEFIFLLFLTVITVITYAALMEKNRYEYSYSPGFTVFYIGLFVVTSLVLMQVLFYSLMRVIVDIQFLSREISSNRRAVFSVLAAENDFLSIQHNLVEMTVDLNIHRRDLETMVEQRTRELQEALSDLKNRAAQLQKQLDMASVIQRSILPGRIDDWNELKFAVRYLAMEKIGGDFYDIHRPPLLPPWPRYPSATPAPDSIPPRPSSRR